MIKKLISYLIIFSILWVDCALCMRRGSWSGASDKDKSFIPKSPLSLQPPERGEGAGLGVHPLPDPASPSDEEKDPAPPETKPESAPPPEDSSSSEEKEPPASAEPKPVPAPEPAVSLLLDEGDEALPPAAPEGGDEDFFTIPKDHGSQYFLEETEALVDEHHLQRGPDEEETLAEKYLRLLKINPAGLTAKELEDLEKIAKIEGTAKNGFVWSNLEILIHKTLFALTTNKDSANKRRRKKCCDPLWLYGGPMPLDDAAALQNNILLKSAGKAFQEGLTESIETIVGALVAYEVYIAFKPKQWEKSWTAFKAVIKNLFDNAEDNAYFKIIKAIHDRPRLLALLAIPVGFALAKTIWSATQISKPTDEGVTKNVRDLLSRSSKWDGTGFTVLSLIPTISALLLFHPLKRNIPRLASLILWQGRLPSGARENALQAIIDLALTRKGVTQMAAIEALAHLTHGMNLRNLTLRPRDVEGLLKIKLRAFRTLQDIYKSLPRSVNKMRTAGLLWELGQSPSLPASILMPIVKLVQLGFYGLTLYTLGSVVYDIIKCQGKYLKNSFTLVGAFTGYVSNYSRDCFTEQVKFFNLLPGQPAYTLIGHNPTSLTPSDGITNLASYNFTKTPYALALFDKGLNGSVIADILEGFKSVQANVSLTALDISSNTIKNSTDLFRIFKALPPGIINLDMSGALPKGNITSDTFLGLGQLVGLQSLNVSNNILTSKNVEAIGQTLHQLPNLQELGISFPLSSLLDMNITQIAQALQPSMTLLNLRGFYMEHDSKGQVALGQAFVLNPNFQQLYLGGTLIGSSLEASIALAQGFAAQQNLSVLDLSRNVLGTYPNVNASTLLGSLPSSLTNLDISFNLVNETSAINALAGALQWMKELVSFYAGGNVLGGSPLFLPSLQEKKKLTVLNLSENSLNDTLQVGALLQTLPSLKALDLSYNSLTNGSILVPVLSSLSNLQSLNLGNNSFTTADRLAIWNATSFLFQSPFPLDEDPTYTLEYLKSFPSTKTSFDLSGLIPHNSTAFQTIMPQVLERFPNLTSLDLSQNALIDYDSVTNTTQTEGIEALITYLPQFKNLQSLSLSGAIDYYDDSEPMILKNFSQTIGALPSLQFLDLSSTYFLIDAGSLGNGLEQSHSLTSFSLSNALLFPEDPCSLGYPQLIQGLQAHSQLAYLDLSQTFLGKDPSGNPDPYTPIVLADALSSWPQLKFLNLAGNYIGYGSTISSAYFLEQLANFTSSLYKDGKTLKINLVHGIVDVEWTASADLFRNLTQQSILKECAQQLCTGKPFNATSDSDSSTSAASRPVPFYQGVINSVKSWFDPTAWKA